MYQFRQSWVNALKVLNSIPTNSPIPSQIPFKQSKYSEEILKITFFVIRAHPLAHGRLVASLIVSVQLSSKLISVLIHWNHLFGAKLKSNITQYHTGFQKYVKRFIRMYTYNYLRAIAQDKDTFDLILQGRWK